MTLALLALRSIARRPLRGAAIALACAALAATLSMASASAVSSRAAISGTRARLGADIIVLPRSAWSGDAAGLLHYSGLVAARMDASVLDAVSSVKGVKSASPQLVAATASLPCCSIGNTLIIGYDPGTDFTVSPWIVKTLGRVPKDDEAVAGSAILSEPGGRLSVYNSVFLVTAKLAPTGIESLDHALYIPMAGVRRMAAVSDVPVGIGPDEITAIMLRTGDGVNADEVAVRIEFAVQGLTALPRSQALAAIERELARVSDSLRSTALVQWISGLICIGALFWVTSNDRRREAAVMRALGARKSDVLKVLAIEALAVSAAGAVIGASAGVLWAIERIGGIGRGGMWSIWALAVVVTVAVSVGVAAPSAIRLAGDASPATGGG